MDGRIEAFVIGRNIGRLLPLLRKAVPDSLQEFTIIHRDNGKIIELMQSVVIKHYMSEELVKHIMNLYDKMKLHHIPFIDSLDKVKIEGQTVSFVILSPKGIQYKPQSEKQLVKSIFRKVNQILSFHLYMSPVLKIQCGECGGVTLYKYWPIKIDGALCRKFV